MYASEKNKIVDYNLSRLPAGPLTKKQTEMVSIIKSQIVRGAMLQNNGVR